ncbi:MAG: 5'/3'-nucleotidase SurE [Armatimonadota bacterium]|nr:5'/3'-nucleotidase SurE [Armatimonadota bacterium]MDR7452402.1 5'/3'-nucleotidase SurE [Armatimonadota bacterium]MDR7466747.1 5'/3'-nucleotidase SurE [Armatimonadota bacterium]MDR7492779.1 5'/3'-nucleotidase SurE [Armatimonadota bacterium]MDR7498555.1 5'/3'-nucleotidase SurE [Armatimonadota bacterium]
MRVLITNDDGIASPGLAALVRAFDRLAECFVVAPEQERSATGHAITLHKPLRAAPATIAGSPARAWSTNGTPADCVALGILDLLEARPDVVVSGINVGPNMGRDLTYSGTVSGAMEGAIFGIPSIAVSIAAFRNPIFTPAAEFAVHLAQAIGRHGLPEDTLLNVNVPNLPREEIRGVAITRQGTRRYVSRLEKRTDPRGRVYYWLTGDPAPQPDEAGTDSWALTQGLISVTPIGLDLTSERLRAELARWALQVPGGEPTAP